MKPSDIDRSRAPDERSFSMKTVKKLEALLEEYYETFKH